MGWARRTEMSSAGTGSQELPSERESVGAGAAGAGAAGGEAGGGGVTEAAAAAALAAAVESI